ncbi:MAG TPA: chloride channel protein [Solirubrobacteraceae bacterium]|nr:chloride channel protein [Solirubrobacteraceae bacterium]
MRHGGLPIDDVLKNRLRRSLARGSGALTVLALLTGVGAGAGAVAFRYLILGFTYLFTGHRDYSAVGHAPNPLVPGLGIWFVVATPVIGGLLYGPLVARFAPEARGHGVPEVMLAVNRAGGRIRPQVPVVKSLASALCIGCGGSVGREGPIVQIGSALGSVIGQASGVSESQLRLLVACGAAGGISATFNAPIAGVFFALELILRNFETRSFGLVVLSSVIADAIGRAAFGSRAFLSLPGFSFSSPLELVLYAGLGLLATLVGVAFVRVLYAGEDLADRLWRGPEWLRPGVGGILLGLLLLAVPEMYGVGYPVLERAVAGHYLLMALIGLLAAKLLATSLTMWIGGSGGVFAPSLFMGAMLGAAYGAVAHHLLPHLAAASGAYGLVGMGAVFAAAARAPITGVIIVFELTGDYKIILPLMFAIVVATALSNRLTHDTIYTLKLRRRGIDIDAPKARGLMANTSVLEAMGAPPRPLRLDQPGSEVIARFSTERSDSLPVTDATGVLLGVVAAVDLEQAVTRDSSQMRVVADLMREAPTVRPEDSLEDGVAVLAAGDDEGIPVIDAAGRLVGWLTHRRVLRTYRRQAGLEETASSRATDQRPLDPEAVAVRG